MQQDNVTDFQQQWESLSSRLNGLYEDPKVSRLMNSRVGRYVSTQPIVALALLVFAVFAVLPVGLFLTFAVVTIIMSAAGFAVVELFLLFVGGVSLLCVLFGIAFFSMVVSLVFNVAYITIFNLLGYSHPALTRFQPGKVQETESKTSKLDETQ